MHKSDVIPGTLVQLRYSDRTRRKQINREISNRAERLDNTPAVVMERPFWDNGTRFVMIRLYLLNLVMDCANDDLWHYFETEHVFNHC